LANDIGRLAARAGYGNVRSVENLVDGLLTQIIKKSEWAIAYGQADDIYGLFAANLHNNVEWIAAQIVNPKSPDAAFFRDAIENVVQTDGDLHGSDGGRVGDGFSRNITNNYLDSVVAWSRGRNPLPAPSQGQVNGAGSSASGGGPALSSAGSGLVANRDPAFLAGLEGVPLINQDGNSIINHDGNSVINQDGSSLIANDGGTLFNLDPSGVVSNDSAGVVSNDSAG
ncbi:MAG: hypothetical protein NTY38_20640, partial [Acidobacteria bacterium]|nr:hypothetical protein [Acidobacteriota bacterium]